MQYCANVKRWLVCFLERTRIVIVVARKRSLSGSLSRTVFRKNSESSGRSANEGGSAAPPSPPPSLVIIFSLARGTSPDVKIDVFFALLFPSLFSYRGSSWRALPPSPLSPAPFRPPSLPPPVNKLRFFSREAEICLRKLWPRAPNV